MDEKERLLKAKIPGPETGIEVKHTICDICCPSEWSRSRAPPTTP